MENLFLPQVQWCLDTQTLTKEDTQRVLEMCGTFCIKWRDNTNAVNYFPQVRYLYFGSVKNCLSQCDHPEYTEITYEELCASFIEHHSIAQEAPIEITHPTVPIGTIVLLHYEGINTKGYEAFYIDKPTTTNKVFDWVTIVIAKAGKGTILTKLRYIEPPKPQR